MFKHLCNSELYPIDFPDGLLSLQFVRILVCAAELKKSESLCLYALQAYPYVKFIAQRLQRHGEHKEVLERDQGGSGM